MSPRILEAPARLDPVRRELDEYFEGRRQRLRPADRLGADRGYTREVLRRTAEIPYGEASTYAEIATWRAARAGGARPATPWGRTRSDLVPCHRVLASSGGIGGYTGGADRKRFLLSLEGVDL